MIPSLYGGQRVGALDAAIKSFFTESELGVDQRWALAGGANGTRTNSGGTIVTAVAPRQDCWNLQCTNNNQLLAPDMLDNNVSGVWFRGNTTVVGQGAGTGPWANGESYKLVEDNTTNFHLLTQAAASTGFTGDKFTLSIYAKAVERTKFVLQSDTNIGTTQTCTFDLSAVTANVSGAGASAGTITAVPGFPGWYRCSFVVTASQTYTGATFKVLLVNGSGSSNYLGDNTSGLLLQGAMLEAGATLHQFQMSTLGENLAPSHLPSGGSWSVTSITVLAGGGTFYDGSAADKLTAGAADSYAGYSISPTWAAANYYTASVWMKADSPRTINLYCIDNIGNTQFTCNLTTAWKRFSVTRSLANAATTCAIQIGGGASFATGGVVYVYGAQLENAPTAGLLVANTVGRALKAALPGMHMGTGLTNLLTNSETFGGWGAAFASITTNSTTAPDGNVTGARWQEDSNASAQYHYLLALSNKLANTTYTFSLFVKWAGRRVGIGMQNNGSTSGCEVVFDPSTGNFASAPTAFGTGFAVQSYGRKYAGNGWWRIWATCSTDATTTQMKNQLVLYNGANNNYIANGSSGAYIWGGQTVQANFPDNYMKTTASTTTSTTDVATLLASSIQPLTSNAFSSNCGALYWEGYYYGHPTTGNAFPAVLGLFNSASRDANSIHIGISDTGAAAATATATVFMRNSSTVSNPAAFTFSKGDRVKLAASWDGVANTYSFAASAGGSVFTSTGTPTVAPPTVDTIGVCPQVSFQPVPEAIAATVGYWQRPLTMGELQQLVT